MENVGSHWPLNGNVLITLFQSSAIGAEASVGGVGGDWKSGAVDAWGVRQQCAAPICRCSAATLRNQKSEAHCRTVREVLSPKPSEARRVIERQRVKPLSEMRRVTERRSPKPSSKVRVTLTLAPAAEELGVGITDKAERD